MVIAKLDATANEVEGVHITQFPSLKLFIKNTNEVIHYLFFSYKKADLRKQIGNTGQQLHSRIRSSFVNYPKSNCALNQQRVA